MKHRITYLLPEGLGIDPADIKVISTPADIKIRSHYFEFKKAASAAEEWRLTLGLDELRGRDEVCCLLRHVSTDVILTFFSCWPY